MKAKFSWWWSALLILLIFTLFFTLTTKKTSAISLLRPFGGRVLTITPNVNLACPAGTHIITIGPLAPFTAIFTNTPGLVKNGPAKVGAWTLGLALPPVPPCFPVVTIIMGVGKVR